jgi:hypothetical protein
MRPSTTQRLTTSTRLVIANMPPMPASVWVNAVGCLERTDEVDVIVQLNRHSWIVS